MPTGGRHRVQFGGQTSCFEIISGTNRLIVDAGTGLAGLGNHVGSKAEGSVDLLFTHFHWDHMIGLTGFRPLFLPGWSVGLHSVRSKGATLKSAMRALFKEPFFPIAFDALSARLAFHDFKPEVRFTLNGFDVRTLPLNHPNGATGYRFDNGSGSVAIITDHEHGDIDIDKTLIEFCRDADLLIYDAMWDQNTDYALHKGWGHSTWQAGLSLLESSGARRLVCVHHDPHSNDKTLLERENRLRAHHSASLFARDGLVLSVRT